MDWAEAMRRIGSGEPVEDVLDKKNAAERADFRVWLRRQPDGETHLARYDARLRDLDTGITAARNAWHSISTAQQQVLTKALRVRSGRIVRRSIKPSVYVHDGGNVLLCRVSTIRNLCAHELLAWDGGAFDPEQAAVITERGRFVATQGREAWERAQPGEPAAEGKRG